MAGKSEATARVAETGDRDIRLLPVKDLTIDGRYQRVEAVKLGLVEKIVREYRPELLGLLLVSEDRGRLRVVDGQHRLLALKELGVDMVLCEVVKEAMPEQASTFVTLNKNRNPMSQFSLYKARLAEGDEVANEVRDILLARGLALSAHKGNAKIAGVARVMTVHSRYGPAILDAALQTITDAWGFENQRALSGEMVIGMGRLLASHPDIDRDELVGKLSATAPDRLVGEARDKRHRYGWSSETAHYLMLLDRYNTSRRRKVTAK